MLVQLYWLPVYIISIWCGLLECDAVFFAFSIMYIYWSTWFWRPTIFKQLPYLCHNYLSVCIVVVVNFISSLYSLDIVICLLLFLGYQDRALPFQWCQDIPWKRHQIYSLWLPGGLNGFGSTVFCNRTSSILIFLAGYILFVLLFSWLFTTFLRVVYEQLLHCCALCF